MSPVSAIHRWLAKWCSPKADGLMTPRLFPVLEAGRRAAALNRGEINLAGDVRTMPEAAKTLTEVPGRPIAFAQTPIERVRQYSREMALMLEWFERVNRIELGH